jgi:hypothetical protein
MAIVNKDLYVLPSQSAFLDNLTGPAYGTDAFPAFVAGDTLVLRVFYLDPFDSASNAAPIHRYAGAATTVRLRAAGNNTIYATGAAGSEIVPATGVTLASLAAGGAHTIKVVRVTFNSAPATGTFRVTFDAPSSSANVPGGLDHVYAAEGTTAPIPFNATIAQIEAALNALPFFRYRSNDGGGKLGGTYNVISSFPVASFKIRNRDATGFEIHFGELSLQGGQNWNPQAYALVNPTVDVANIQWPYGWNVSVPLDGNGHTFADLFNPANSPAFFEVVLTPAGGSPQVAAQRQITSAGAPGDPPDVEPPTGGGGGGGSGLIAPPPVGGAGVHYNVGDLVSPFPIEDVRISQRIPRDPTSLVLRQRFIQWRLHYAPLPHGVANCPHHGAAVCVDESETEDIGGYICRFERVWAIKPANRTEPGPFLKITKQMKIQVNNGVADLTSAVLLSRAKSVTADFEYRYYNTAIEAVPALPDTPEVFVVRVGSFVWVEAYGGFNPHAYGGVNWGGDNFGRVFLGGEASRPYMGTIVEQLRIYG